MRGEKTMEKILDKINLIGGGAVVLFSYIFGSHWYLFVAFLVLNVVDYITGIAKARMYGVENSNKGMKGIIKKVGYWVVIGIAFFVSVAFGEMGQLIGLDLGITQLFGWFTLATFLINEIRSILENLVQMGVYVPEFLTKGLEVAQKVVDNDE